MPIYEFKCSKCGIQEWYLNTTEPDPTKCECGLALKKVMSRTSVGLDKAGRSTINRDSSSSLSGDFIGDGDFSITPSR